jgi:hypothetical protein
LFLFASSVKIGKSSRFIKKSRNIC